ncbi:MAG TPA: ABC transporter ATP-binding protein [Planctomycetota bacterium]|nr:ABC transporter ATP-binding protein [Planctomycetota bacterium]
MPEPAVVLKDVRKTYEQKKVKVEALRGVDLEVAPGEFVAITGASGSGKSTLLHLAGALDIPTSGTLTVLGETLSTMPDNQLAAFRRRKLGFVFQFFNLLPTLSAVENAALPLLLDGMPREEALTRGRGILERTGMGERLEHRPEELSGGQQQRVALARALVADPMILLADEPTGNLDSEAGARVLDLIEDARQRRGLTVLLVTHDPGVAKRADRVVRLRDGKVESIEARAS